MTRKMSFSKVSLQDQHVLATSQKSMAPSATQAVLSIHQDRRSV